MGAIVPMTGEALSSDRNRTPPPVPVFDASVSAFGPPLRKAPAVPDPGSW